MSVEVEPFVVLQAVRYSMNRATSAHGESMRLIKKHEAALLPFRDSILHDLQYVLKFPHPALSDYELAETQRVIDRVAAWK